MSHNGLSQCCMHVHQPVSQVCKLGESLALRKVKHPHNGKTSVSRFPLTKQEILSQYSSCFEGIGRFSGDLYKFHLKPDHKPARHAPRKVPVHLVAAFKEEIKSLVKQGILEEVKEHTDWVNSYVIVEKDTGNQHAPNHTVKKNTVHSHAEFPPGMESTPFFPGKQFLKQFLQGNEKFILPDIENMSVFLGNQFLQGKEKFMGTGTFTLGITTLIKFLNRYSTLSTLTHQATDYKPGRVPQNFKQMKTENSNMEAFPDFNTNAEATLQMDTSKKGPRAKDIPVTETFS